MVTCVYMLHLHLIDQSQRFAGVAKFIDTLVGMYLNPSMHLRAVRAAGVHMCIVSGAINSPPSTNRAKIQGLSQVIQQTFNQGL